MKIARSAAAVVASVVLLGLAGAAGYTGDAAEVSRSRGPADGIVVLWPRVSPADPAMDELARTVQQQLVAAATEAMPGARITVRPNPQRVCPPEGCRATAIGALIAHQAGGCVIVATIASPNKGQVSLVPWAGQLKLEANTIAFDKTAEEQVQVVDFTPCASIALDTKAIRDAIANGTP